MTAPICLVCHSRCCAHVTPANVLTPAEQRIIRAILAQPGEPLKVIAAELHIQEQSLRTALYRMYMKMGLSGSGCLRALIAWASEHRDLLDSAA